LKTVGSVDLPSAIDGNAHAVDEIVFAQELRRMRDVLCSTHSPNECTVRDLSLMFLVNVFCQQDRAGLNTVDANTIVPSGEFDGQRFCHHLDGPFAGKIRGVIKVRAYRRPITNIDNRSASILLDHSAASGASTKK
jgi:hypothetical protein